MLTNPFFLFLSFFGIKGWTKKSFTWWRDDVDEKNEKEKKEKEKLSRMSFTSCCEMSVLIYSSSTALLTNLRLWPTKRYSQLWIQFCKVFFIIYQFKLISLTFFFSSESIEINLNLFIYFSITINWVLLLQIRKFISNRRFTLSYRKTRRDFWFNSTLMDICINHVFVSPKQCQNSNS